LKTNSEALATARLLFATWPARNDVPDAFVAIEFATNDEAQSSRQAGNFLPTVLPPATDPLRYPLQRLPARRKPSL